MTVWLPAVLCLSLSAFAVAETRAQRRAAAPRTTKTTAQKKQPVTAAAQTASAQTSAARTLTLHTEPKAAVWIDDLRWGTTDDRGQLILKNVPAGRHTLRVRATSFAEKSMSILPTTGADIQLPLVRTNDEAELLFQQAEDAREGILRADGTRGDAVELYRRALALRPNFPAAHVGLARALMSRDLHEEALDEIEAARRLRPIYPEASAVEGRILRAAANADEAILSYRRAIREGRGVQPEAFAGLGIIYEERGEYEDAVVAFRKAIAQLYDTEPALYQLLGASLEKLERWKEAVAAYEKYLALAPEGKLAPAIRSILDQLRQQAAEQQQPTTPQL